MKDKITSDTATRDELALERTRMAMVRTEFSLIRTGFTIASFGTVITQLLGRDIWHDLVTDGLTTAFVLMGMVMVQSGLVRYHVSLKTLGVGRFANPLVLKAMKVVPWILQATLLVLLVLILVH